MQEFKLPPYVEENDGDDARMQNLRQHEDFPILIKKLNNRIAEHTQTMVTEKDTEYCIRIEEVLSILSELTNE